ncbi:polysaccharide biosynthesis protein [Trichococcus shcherbakoviae]|uniref:Polysaccharide biosynthesis protein n=1 Tax=Trichococcus shcherbakoviae TaxID=2094020 RepID=A0A383TF81_9LACT|nr:nucleoside-diphosphate sugar epimerase/dehydratase [Trichococcus shcherbakoviae]SYZ78314.1 polysaccharide biosynthesis protein [Trichococcus shcherbakoviae]
MPLNLSRKQKSIVLILLDSLFIFVSALLSYWLIQSYIAPPHTFFYVMVGVCIGSYIMLGLQYHLFSRIIRYTSVYEVGKSTILMTISYALSALITLLFIKGVSFRYIFLMYMFSLVFIPGSRVVWRLYHEWNDGKLKKNNLSVENTVRTLVVGAGAGGSIFINSILRHPSEIEVVGIVDGDKNKANSRLFDIPVVGTKEDIPALVKACAIDQVTIAIPSLKPPELEAILDYCNQANVKVNQMPRIEDVLKGKLTVSRLRNIDVVDLLGREEVQLDRTKIGEQLENEVVLVSGAGGSIGSEICRQIAKFSPKTLILLGHGENSIYLIDKELNNLYGRTITIIPIIADIQDRDRIFQVMEKYKPDHVFHAAAHKHVPLMEYNPHEAIKNNVYGSKNMAEAAKAAGVKSFVMISTDKAVRPTNVMGSTKRIAEILVTSLNEPGKTKFAAVRFGNVLGSRGSVIPVFKEQIENGGPVTVTDMRMIRYFMTIPEASRLVLQAGVLAKGGEIFILDMGEPVKISDLARKMIKLSGYTEAEIPIVESGIRPGEKLYEELLVDGQLSDNQVFDKIFVGNAAKYDRTEVLKFVESLGGLSHDDLRDEVIAFANENV